jgi:hypothetical protein
MQTDCFQLNSKPDIALRSASATGDSSNRGANSRTQTRVRAEFADASVCQFKIVYDPHIAVSKHQACRITTDFTPQAAFLEMMECT